MYQSDVYKKLPTTVLKVQGRDIEFLVDSGATNSVLKKSLFPNQKLSGRLVLSRSASGMVLPERFTTPMTCVHTDPEDSEPERRVKCAFLLSPVCPVNLLGRDLMSHILLSLKLLSRRVSCIRSVLILNEPVSTTDTFLHGKHEGLPTDVSPLLAEVPRHLWATHKYDVGLIKNCQPVVIMPRSNFRPQKHQYPLKQEAIDGIRPVFNSLLTAGVIIPCPDSPVRTPIFPVKKIRAKDLPTEWRFVQDLKAVNAAVHARAPNVPNPYTILQGIRGDAAWFSVVDLSNAFFSVPVDKESQYWFAFLFDGKPYTFTRLCQGYTESPTIYNDALRDSLESLTLSPGSSLLQYVDDILIASSTKEMCERDTIALLCHLATEGHKASLTKLPSLDKG
uniref:ribonuclease H n=1 Tax=Sander lucioperca TaxID=283035 RepID=A0A8C9Z436_SANLU